MNLLSNLIAKANADPILLDVKSGIDKAQSIIMDNVKYAVNKIVIPIGVIILIIALLALIIKMRELHKANQDYSDKIIGVIIIIALIALVASAPLWIWHIAGV